jgi:hypothetical protein
MKGTEKILISTKLETPDSLHKLLSKFFTYRNLMLPSIDELVVKRIYTLQIDNVGAMYAHQRSNRIFADKLAEVLRYRKIFIWGYNFQVTACRNDVLNVLHSYFVVAFVF